MVEISFPCNDLNGGRDDSQARLSLLYLQNSEILQSFEGCGFQAADLIVGQDQCFQACRIGKDSSGYGVQFIVAQIDSHQIDQAIGQLHRNLLNLIGVQVEFFGVDGHLFVGYVSQLCVRAANNVIVTRAILWAMRRIGHVTGIDFRC